VFTALGNPTRRAILKRLCAGPATVTEVAAPLRMSLNAVSKHLMHLERADLIRREVEGRVHHLFLNAGPLEEAEHWVSRYRQFWEFRLDSLENWLQHSKKGKKK